MSAIEVSREIPITDVERRLLRACKTLRALPDRERGWQVVRSLWPAGPAETALIDQVDLHVRPPKFVPTPKDVGDYLVALSWLKGIKKEQFRFLWWRSCQLSFGWMSRRIGYLSDETCRRRYKEIILNAWYAANWPDTKSS